MKAKLYGYWGNVIGIGIGDYFYATHYKSKKRGLYILKKIIIKPNKQVYNVFRNVITKEEMTSEYEYSHYRLYNVEKCKDDVYITYTNKNNCNDILLSNVNDIKLFGKNNINEISVIKIIKCDSQFVLRILKQMYNYQG